MDIWENIKNGVNKIFSGSSNMASYPTSDKISSTDNRIDIRTGVSTIYFNYFEDKENLVITFDFNDIEKLFGRETKRDMEKLRELVKCSKNIYISALTVSS